MRGHVIDISDSDDEAILVDSSPPRKKPRNEQNAPPRNKSPVDALSGFVAQILEVVPDVDPDHLNQLVRDQTTRSADNVVEVVIHTLFENPYPKVDRKGKRKRVEEHEDDAGVDARHRPKAKVDFSSADRPFKGGPHYAQLCIDQLMTDFPLIPKPYIRQILLKHHSLYAPTFIYLQNESHGDVLPYTLKTIPSQPHKGKGKGRALHDGEFTKERSWIVTWTEDHKAGPSKLQEAEAEECQDGVECGCCFTDYSFEKMIQCPDAHLFCGPCMLQYAETLLGSHDIKIICMDQSGCKLLFPMEQLKRFLTPKLLELYERVKQNKEVAAAGIEGLEECPFCEFKCVIENEQEKLFVCRAEECAAITCRQCKELDHLPKSCKEVAEDKKAEGRHHIEEAMTAALMRNCPRCKKAFIKEMGCNKMICPECQAMSCYVCRELITGYEHFATQPGQPVTASTSRAGRCPLWDSQTGVEGRHADEVKAAAERAREEYKRANPDAQDEDLKVDLPAQPPPLPAPVPAAVGRGFGGIPIPNINMLPPIQFPNLAFNRNAIWAAVPPIPQQLFVPPPPIPMYVPPAAPIRQVVPRRRRAPRRAR